MRGVEVLARQKCPGVHGEHSAKVGLPNDPLHLPAGQAMHAEREEAPTVEL